ncbi:class I glutamine amidotransferase-like protein [Tricladium varicosporioides]|nr:class I glutamine amidotransferase-like protein [Hymenoscyphus varicosporioides]
MTMKEEIGSKIQVCFLMFHGHDVLDYAGPYEVFANILRNPDSPNPSHIFDITLIAVDPVISSSRNLCVNRNMSILEAHARIEEFDILILPGGPLRVLRDLYDRKSPEMKFLSTFATLPTRRYGCSRIILSVCTGALLLGCARLLCGRRATTHHKALDALEFVCQPVQGRDELPTEVVMARFVDAGLLDNGTRIVTAGGISCGIDASLYVMELVAGKEMADVAGEIMEYNQAVMELNLSGFFPSIRVG